MSAAKVIAEAAWSYFDHVRRYEGYIVDGVDGDRLADDVLIALYAAGWRVIPQQRRYCNRCGSAFPAEHKCGRDR